MSVPTCSIPDCSYEAKERCARCGEVFCTLHITSTFVGYYCDTCMVEERKESGRKVRKGFWKGVLIRWIDEAIKAFFK